MWCRGLARTAPGEEAGYVVEAIIDATGKPLHHNDRCQGSR